MTTYEQAKAVVESYGYNETKEAEFVKKYTQKKYGWRNYCIDEVEVTVYLLENGEYNGENIEIINDSLEFDGITDLEDSLRDVYSDIDGIKNELDDIEFYPEEDEE